MNEERKKVSWTIFVWAIGIIFVIFTMMFAQIQAVSSKIDESTEANAIINQQLSAIKTDLEWIKKNLDK